MRKDASAGRPVRRFQGCLAGPSGQPPGEGALELGRPHREVCQSVTHPVGKSVKEGLLPGGEGGSDSLANEGDTPRLQGASDLSLDPPFHAVMADDRRL